ncbi:MAG: LarC family nickel insertion protein [Deltaproteobacteria bacterium]|nr:LarC family nickel insertion protein [Deltaproteobacteria bacterium]
MPRHLHIDPSRGIAEETLLAGLLSLGAPLEAVQEAVGRITAPGVRLRLAPAEVVLHGVKGLSVRLEPEALPEEPPGTFGEVRRRVEGALAPGRTRDRALGALDALAQATARTAGSGTEADEVQSAEGLRTAVYLVAVAAALEALSIESVTCGPLPLPAGEVAASSGPIPSPVDAALELLRGRSVGAPVGAEAVTPAGLALATSLAEPGPPPSMILLAWGTGVVADRVSGPPPRLRLFLGEREPEGETEPLLVLEANLDDLSAEILATLPAACLEAGALDSWLVPALMKKGRPAHVLHALCAEERSAAVQEAVFRHSSTLGVRRYRIERASLERSWEEVRTPWGAVRIKVARRGGEVLNRAPEFEDCRALSNRTGVPLKQVYAEALAAALRR